MTRMFLGDKAIDEWGSEPLTSFFKVMYKYSLYRLYSRLCLWYLDSLHSKCYNFNLHWLSYQFLENAVNYQLVVFGIENFSLWEKEASDLISSFFFMYQVLSVVKALSIQANPDKYLGSTLHRKLPYLYKYSNHKLDGFGNYEIWGTL